MKRMISLFSLASALMLALVLASCSDDQIDLSGNSQLSIRFTHNFDGDAVDSSTFNQFIYINEDGDTLSISKLRYLISDMVLTSTAGDRYEFDGYVLVDLTNAASSMISLQGDVPYGNYSSLSFTFGFDEEDNVSNAYDDLNLALWNWPEMLGGGYHFMQMEGMYMDDGTPMPYAYHNGTARVSENVFEQNFFEPVVGGFTLSQPFADIEIRMDIAEWYRNPHTWDLETLNVLLMPNYNAQKMMQANGATVFSRGSVTQTD